MSLKYVLALCSFLILETGAQHTGQGLSLSLNPKSGKTNPGYDVTFTCTLDLNILTDSPVVWTRAVGTIRTSIGFGTIKQDEFVSMSWYKLSAFNVTGNRKSYTLTISGVHYEDSGVIECSIRHSIRKQAKTLAICASTDTESCSCMMTTGWASPECFGENKSQHELQAQYDKTVLGLGVCFAIALIYGIIITILFARDCVKIIHRKNQRKLAQLKHQQRPGYNPYADSEKLTVEDDAGSIPESGVWSQSEGTNGEWTSSNRSNGMGPRGGIVTNRVPVQRQGENIIRERPVIVHDRPAGHDQPVQPDRAVLAVQAHINAAYNPDDVNDSIAGHGAVATLPPNPSGGVRPKIPAQKMESSPQNSYPPSSYPTQPASSPMGPHGNPAPSPMDYHGNADPYSGDGAPPSYPGEPVPSYSSNHTPQPPEAYHPHAQLPSQTAPSGVRSEDRRAPNRPPQPQRSYTDVPREKHSGPSNARHTEPRQLDFGAGQSVPNGSGHYIDQHDTVI